MHCQWLRPWGLEGCIIQVPSVVKLRLSKVAVVDSRMACFVVAVVPVSVVWLFSGQAQAVVCWYVTNKISLCCFVLDVLLIAVDC